MAVGATFLLTAAIVIVAGTILARSGDVIAARTKLGGLWVGSVFLAIATSLPELTTDIAAVRMNEPDLAAGDLFGSSMANMLILAILNLVPRGTGLFREAALEHVLFAALAVLLTCIAAVTIVVAPATSVARIGAGSATLLAVFLLGSHAIYRHGRLARKAARVEEMSAGPASGAEPEPRKQSLRNAVLAFLAASAVILVAAPRFAASADALATMSGLGTTFVGTWLVGFATSLPELVTGLAAVRMRAFDLAVGNLFGSNAFNMCVFPVLDIAHPGPPILSVISRAHLVSALAAIALMTIGVAAIVYRAQGRLSLREPSSALIIVGYILGLLAVFAAGPA